LVSFVKKEEVGRREVTRGTKCEGGWGEGKPINPMSRKSDLAKGSGRENTIL